MFIYLFKELPVRRENGGTEMMGTAGGSVGRVRPFEAAKGAKKNDEEGVTVDGEDDCAIPFNAFSPALYVRLCKQPGYLEVNSAYKYNLANKVTTRRDFTKYC